MPFEWDSDKNNLNVLKHGIGFEVAQRIFEGPCIEAPDRRKEYGEIRIGAYGEVDGVVLFVIYTWRNGNRRIISARRVGQQEREAYYAGRTENGLGTGAQFDR
jgi:uncharacterized DUF497 family protein